MASNACVAVPTQTLYATAVNTFVQNGDPIIVTITDGLDVLTFTSFNPTTSTVTDVEPTATLYATQCPTTTRAPQTTVSSSTAKTTYERSSTNAGGNVVVQTVVETILQNGTVIQTRTSAPPPASTAVDNTAGDRESIVKQHTGAIAGGIVGAVIALVAILLCLWCVRKRRRNALHSRNLDDFFSDPTAAGWEGAAAGAVGSTRRTATMRSMRSRSATVLDLEKESGSAAQDGENNWAALTPLDADEELMSEARPQSRHSLNTLGRPMSFHSMSAGHGLDVAAMHDEEVDPVLLRNDSDRSSKSNLTPGALQPPQSPDFVPAYYGYSSSPPPISPASSPPPQAFSPYGSPAPQEAALYEGLAYDSTTHGTVQRFNSISGSLRAGRSSFGSGAGMLSPTSKHRTLSNGAMAPNDLLPRPQSAQGLATSPAANDIPAGYSATFAARVMQYHSMQAPSPPQSPPMLAVNGRRGRASVSSGTTAQYPNASRYGSQSPPPAVFPSLHQSPSNGFPPSPYAHLDVHKTAEEREEDAHSALPAVSAHVNEVGQSASARARLQRRHQSMSSDILLRVVNQGDREALASDPQHGTSKDSRGTLSIRNGD